MKNSRLYYEAHITIRADEEIPYVSDEWDYFKTVLDSDVWKCSRFDEDDGDNYKDMWFCSTRHANWEKITEITKNALNILKDNDYDIIRWKIEDTILDSKYGDKL